MKIYLDAERKLNNELERIVKWLCVNKLKLSVDKTKCMIINNKNNIVPVQIKIDGSKIVIVDSMGLVIDKNLKMDKHEKYICKKTAKRWAS